MRSLVCIIILLTLVFADKNQTIEVIDLVYRNGYYFVDTFITGKGNRYLLLDTNTPSLLLLSSNLKNEDESEVGAEVRTLPFVSDLSTSILSLKDSWKRGLRINNIDPNKTVEIPYIDMYDYSIQSVIDEDINPHIIEWRELSGGIFGLGTTKWKSNMMTILDALQISSFGLYLNQNSPRIDINQFSDQYINSISWGNRMSSSSRLKTSAFFHIYSFSICDVSLFGSFTSHYPAVISPASQCLTVPMQIFNNIAAWLKIICPSRSSSNSQNLCYLSPEWDAKSDFPTFTFRMDNRETPLFISVQQLLIENGNRKYICLLNGTDLNTKISHPLSKQGFIFGSMVLSSFYVAINQTEGRVGLAPLTTINPSKSNCLLKNRCLAGQTYHLASNSCKEPNCDAYYFMTLHEDKHECRTHPIAIILFWGIVIYYIFCELNQFVQTNRNRQLLLHNVAR